MSNSINIYGAGGAGINISKNVEYDRSNPNNKGFATINNYYVDTSDSNMDKTLVNADNTYLVDISDDPNAAKGGSGKKRDSNFRAISERINDILLRFKPSATLNIIVHSASGGSGSVIGPLLVRELIKRKLPFLVCMVGSHGSKIEIQNTIKTLESYENIADINKVPVSALYLENGVGIDRKTVDEKIRVSLLLTAMIFSGDIRELDDSDLRNFLDFTKVTSYQPRLSYLKIEEGNIKLEKEETVISAVSVSDDEGTTDLSEFIEYQATGFLVKEYYTAFEIKKPIHFLNIAGSFNGIANALKLRLKEYETARSAAIDKRLIQDVDDSNDGLVF